MKIEDLTDLHGDGGITDRYIDEMMEHYHNDVPSVLASIDHAAVIVLLRAYKGDITKVTEHIDRVRHELVKILRAIRPNGTTH